MRRMLATTVLVASLAVPAAAAAQPNDVSATRYFREQASGAYDGPVYLGDGRGCARASVTLYKCTAYVRATKAQIYGTVMVAKHDGVRIIAGISLTTVPGSANNKITQWFSHTDGGCQTNSCAGTVYRNRPTSTTSGGCTTSSDGTSILCVLPGR